MNKTKIRLLAGLTSVSMIGATVLTPDSAENLLLPVQQDIYAEDSLSVKINADKIFPYSSKVKIPVEISGAIPNDAWITFVPSDVPHTEKDGDDNNGDWCYLSEIKDGVALLMSPPKEGKYDIRVYDGDDEKTAKEIAYYPVEIILGETIKVAVKADKYVQCSSKINISVEMTGTIPDDAWITFVPSDVPHTEKDGDDNNGDWCYLSEIKDGVALLTSPSKEGKYDIRVYDGDDAETAKEIASYSVEVTSDKISDHLAFTQKEAEYFDEYQGIDTDSICVCCVNNGDYTAYYDLDFGTGAKSFYASCSAAYSSGGTIELRLDSEKGKKIGELVVTYTGTWVDYENFCCNIDTVSGVHDLYFVFVGKNDDYLLNIDHFVFSEKTAEAAPAVTDVSVATTTMPVSKATAAITTTTPVSKATAAITTTTPVSKATAAVTTTSVSTATSAVTTTSVTSTSTEKKLGDVNGDGKLTTSDARMILQYAVGLIEFTDAQKALADVNKDGKISTTDASRLLRFVVGVIDEL